MNGGNCRLQLILADRSQRPDLTDKSDALIDQSAIPESAVLLSKGYDLTSVSNISASRPATSASSSITTRMVLARRIAFPKAQLGPGPGRHWPSSPR